MTHQSKDRVLAFAGKYVGRCSTTLDTWGAEKGVRFEDFGKNNTLGVDQETIDNVNTE